MKQKTLTKALCQKWIKALRSGKYKQGKERLSYGNQHGSFFCCLGVAEKVCGLQRDDPFLLVSSRPLLCRTQNKLAKMNDDGATFSAIADYIESEVLPECPDEEREE